MQIKVEAAVKESITPKKGDLLLINGKLFAIEDDGDDDYNLYVREVGGYDSDECSEESVHDLFESLNERYNYEPKLGVNYFPEDRTTVTLTLGE